MSSTRRPTAALAALLGTTAFAAFLFALPEPPAAASPDAPASGDFAVVGALVFDGEAFREDTDVWIEGGRVKAVGAGIELPGDLPRVEGRGRTLLPGLIDAHAHTFGTARKDALRFGVTTLLDQFTHPAALGAARRDRETIGPSDEADLFSAGFLATSPGGHGTEYGLPVPTLSRPDEAAAWVDARLAEGSDWIKIVYDDGSVFGFSTLTTLDRDTLAALVEAAHTRDKLAVVHVARLSDAMEAVEAGADGLVHTWVDEVIGEEDAARIARAGAFVTPTLSVNHSVLGDPGHRALLEGPAAERLSPTQRDSLGRSFPHQPGSRADVKASVESVARLRAAGVPLLAGTDAPNPGTAFGISSHREMALLKEAGLTVEEVLAASTSIPADAYRIGDRGRLAPGQLADLLLVEGDVRADLSATLRSVGVWKDGAPVDLAPPAAPETRGQASADGPLRLGSFTEGTESWGPTTDEMMGGASTVELAVEEEALTVRGEVKAVFPFPWAGAAVGLSPDGPMDVSGYRELRFRVRGDGKPGRVMLIVADGAGPPPSLAFQTGPAWTDVRLPLADIEGSLSRVQAIAFVAGPATGAFELRIDEVELR